MILKKLLVAAAVAAVGYKLTPPKVLWKYGIRVPYPMEEFAVDDASGARLSSFDCVGRPVLLITWGAWCPYMAANLPQIEKMKARFAYSDVCVVPVSNDKNPAKAWAFARDTQMAEPYYWGYRGLSDMYWGYGASHVFLFDRKGFLKVSEELNDTNYETLANAVVNVIQDGSPKSATPSPTRPGQAALADEGRRELAEIGKDGARLLAAGSIDELDARAGAWRKNRERTAQDVWKEAVFYDSLILGYNEDETEDAQYAERIRFFEAWAATRPASVAARVALGGQWYNYAWRARGTGWSSEVSDENSRLYRERLDKARAALTEAAALPETSPVVFAELLKLARSQGWDDDKTGELFRRATAFEPDYLNYYSIQAMSLIPRWGGSDEAVARFAKDSADARTDGRGDELYARILESILFAYESENRSPFDAGFSWPRVKSGCAKMMTRRPSAQSACAKAALMAGDKASAREMFMAMGGRYDREIWRDFRDFARDRARAVN